MDDSDDSVPWVEQYCFVETEFFPFDYESMNYYTSTHPDSFFMPHIVAMRLLVEEDKDGSEGDVRITGILTYFNEEVRKRVEGSMERAVVQKVTAEAERIEALERWFRISLSEEDRKAIFTTTLALDK
ncbi:hypothetical protein NQ176_g4382 [Zarea fungicola]|uniref:Uncharacterized protein n=1 Tax=Zarea fungicola TaxID=93591 RepID=A0ACC1NGC5_9HYPO|nr:hypothetical protein NQ176_g4382 [Lecanicillium fungicola]